VIIALYLLTAAIVCLAWLVVELMLDNGRLRRCSDDLRGDVGRLHDDLEATRRLNLRLLRRTGDATRDTVRNT
jgi:hypothetical protein